VDHVGIYTVFDFTSHDETCLSSTRKRFARRRAGLKKARGVSSGIDHAFMKVRRVV
jgi:hypothetical protein